MKRKRGIEDKTSHETPGILFLNVEEYCENIAALILKGKYVKSKYL